MTSHRSHRLARLMVVGLTATALAAPAAVARPLDGPDEPVRPDPFDSQVVVLDPPVVQTIDDGFDWGSAAIGAGGTGALIVLVSLGGFAYASRSRASRRRPVMLGR